MKFSTFASVAAALTSTAAAFPAAQNIQAESSYPVGTAKSSNVKVAGRLFNIDGRVGYFAGKLSARFCPSSFILTIAPQEAMLGGLAISARTLMSISL